MKRKSTFIFMLLFMNLLSFGAFAQINTNGDFENWTGTHPVGWYGSSSNTTTIAKITDGAFDGNNALQLINTTSGHKRYTTSAVSIENGRKYAIEFYAKGKGDLRMGLFGGGNSSSYKYELYHNINSTSYTQYFDTITAETSATNAQFILSFRNTDEDLEHIIVDNVFITEVVDQSFVYAPQIEIEGTTFVSSYTGTVTVSLSTQSSNADIYYTIDGTTPDETSTLYTEPFSLTESATVKAVAIANGFSSQVTSESVQITVFDYQPLYVEDFEGDGFNDMTFYFANNSVKWTHGSYSGNHYAYANGHNSTVDGEAWLMTPPIDPNGAASVMLSFVTAKNYSGYPIMVKYSTDYSGSGDPMENGTWTDITEMFTFSSGSFAFTNSGWAEIQVSQPVRFAWVYLSAPGSAAAWEVDDIFVGASNSVILPELAITAPANGAQFSSLDTLPVGIDIQNFELGTDGYLKLESTFLTEFGIENPFYLGQNELSALMQSVITPLPAGTHTVTASLVDMNQTALSPAVTATTTFTVTQPQLSAPLFSPEEGTYADSVTVSLTSAENAEIRFTTDGTTPTINSTLYSSPVTLHESATINAKAFKANWDESDIATANYTIVNEPVLTVNKSNLEFNSQTTTQNFVVSGAHLTSPITLSCQNEHFTLSQTEIQNPNNNTEISVTFDNIEPANSTISIVSGELSATVNLNATAKLPTPEFTPVTAVSDSEITVTISCNIADAEIYYTTDGTTPSTESSLYTSALIFNTPGNYQVNAIAVKDLWENSEIATANYVITTPSVGDTVIYSVGFEDFEGFEATQSYNNTTILYFGPDDKQWGTYYGTPSTNNHIAGGQSMQMRWYTSASQNFGYAFTNFDLNNVTHVTFAANSSNGLKVNVSHSFDGGNTYSEGETFTLTSIAQTFDYVVDPTGSYDFVRLKFSVVLPETSVNATSRVVIDSVVVFGIPGLEVTTVSSPVISPVSGFYYEPQTVTITCSEEDAVIRYTLDGSEPTENSAIYSASFEVNTNTTVKAKAWKEGMTPSFVSISEISFPTQVENIAAFKAAGSNSAQQIMSDVTFVFRSGRFIFVEDNSAALLIYDNSTPVITNSYNEGDVINGGIFGTYQLYNGMVELIPTHNSAEATGTTTVTPVTTSITEIKNNYNDIYEAKLVTLENVEFINDVTFVQNGDTMAIYDRFNSISLDIEAGATAKVTGFVSYSTNFGYQIYPRNDEDIVINGTEIQTVATPVFHIYTSGEFDFMNLTCETEGAEIFYTIDGTTPDETSYQFTSDIPLPSAPLTLKAIAKKEGFNDSEIAVYDYTGISERLINVSVYPNPVSDILYINSSNLNCIPEKVEIYNSIGKLVKINSLNGNVNEISLSDLSNGIYVAKIFTDKGTTSISLIKK